MTLQKRRGMNRAVAIFSILIIYLAWFVSAEKAKNDVLVVKNSSEPLYGHLKLDLREKVLFDSSENSTGSYIYWIKDMVVDSHENIHLLARGLNDCILKLSPSGELLRNFILKQGQGPGEFQMYTQFLYRDKSDNLYVYDANKMIVFDKDMSFERNIHVSPVNYFRVDDRGFLYTMKRIYSQFQLHKVLAKFDREGNLIKEFKDTYYYECNETGKIHTTLSHKYSPRGYFCITSDNQLIYANSLDYKLFKYDLDGDVDLKSIILINEKPKKIKNKEKHELIERLKKIITSNRKIDWNLYFPDHRPFFKDIFIDEKDRIYLLRIKPVFEEKYEEIVDIISKDGRYLYETKVPYLPQFRCELKAIRNGCIYLIDKKDKDKDGNLIYRVKKWVIENYDSMKY